MQSDLVVRASAGDHAAFSQLASASIGGLYRIAHLILRDGDLANDAVQNARATPLLMRRPASGHMDQELPESWPMRPPSEQIADDSGVLGRIPVRVPRCCAPDV
jgi:hypothetical protein